MNTYTLSDEAIRDLEELCDYIAQTELKAASQIFDRIRQRCKLLAFQLWESPMIALPPISEVL